MRVPGPGIRRFSSPERIASAPTACALTGPSSRSSAPGSTWYGSTSPDTSAIASTSVCVTGRETLTGLPISISSNVTFR